MALNSTKGAPYGGLVHNLDVFFLERVGPVGDVGQLEQALSNADATVKNSLHVGLHAFGGGVHDFQ